MNTTLEHRTRALGHQLPPSGIWWSEGAEALASTSARSTSNDATLPGRFRGEDRRSSVDTGTPQRPQSGPTSSTVRSIRARFRSTRIERVTGIVPRRRA